MLHGAMSTVAILGARADKEYVVGMLRSWKNDLLFVRRRTDGLLPGAEFGTAICVNTGHLMPQRGCGL
jgi:hypothetical protein